MIKRKPGRPKKVAPEVMAPVLLVPAGIAESTAEFGKPVAVTEKEIFPQHPKPDETVRMGSGHQEPYRYPDFKPTRDPVPEGVKWARIKRELGHELQKVAVYEEDDHLPQEKRREVLVWMTLREQRDSQARKGRLIGQVFAIEPNPEERQGGYRLWYKR